MRQAPSFLVIVEDPDRLFLISTTLHRKFPNSVVQTCRDSHAALEVAREKRLDAIVANRSTDRDELPLLESLRAITRRPFSSCQTDMARRRRWPAAPPVISIRNSGCSSELW